MCRRIVWPELDCLSELRACGAPVPLVEGRDECARASRLDEGAVERETTVDVLLCRGHRFARCRVSENRAVTVRIAQSRVCECIAWIGSDRELEIFPCLSKAYGIASLEEESSTKVRLVCLCAGSAPSRKFPNRRWSEVNAQLRRDRPCYFVLHGEDVTQRTVVFGCPQRRVVCGGQQGNAHAQRVCVFLHASIDQIADVERFADLRNGEVSVLQAE